MTDRRVANLLPCVTLHDLMRWAAYFILAYLFVGMQVGLRGFLDFAGASPDLVLLAVIFIAINAPRDAALLGAFGLGLTQDLLTLQPLGLYALGYSLTAMFIVSTQEIVYREHPLTHFSLALVGGVIIGILLMLHTWIWPGLPGVTTATGERLPPLHSGLVSHLLSALFTACLSPFVLFILMRIKTVFAFQAGRKRLMIRR